MIQITGALSKWYTGKPVSYPPPISLLTLDWEEKVKEFEVGLTVYKQCHHSDTNNKHSTLVTKHYTLPPIYIDSTGIDHFYHTYQK